MRFKYKYILSAALACVFLLGSCSSEEPAGGGGGGGAVDVLLRVPITRGASEAENKVSNARMIVFERGGSRQMLVNKRKYGENITFEEVVKAGYLDVFLIANELDQWDLGNVASAADLRAKALSFSAYPAVDASNLIPMAGIYENLLITSSGVTTINGSPVDLNSDPSVTGKGTVDRLYAKVTLNLNCSYADLPGGYEIGLESVSVNSLPRASYLAPASYNSNDEAGYFDGAAAQMVLGTNYFETSQAGQPGFNGVFSFYVPEYLVANAGRYSYLSIVACSKANSAVKFKYKLALGDGIAKGNLHMTGSAATLADLRVSRNKHYTFTVTKITNFGEVDGMEVFPVVDEWSPVGVDNTLVYKTLSVSAVKTSMMEYMTRRIYFTSNQPEVVVQPELKYTKTKYNTTLLKDETSATLTAQVDDFFQNLAGSGAAKVNYTYNAATKTGVGYCDMVFRVGALDDFGATYKFYLKLDANGLTRQLELSSQVPYHWRDLPCATVFFRMSQKGERIIHAGHTGNWAVYIPTPMGGSAFVASTSPSGDQNLKTDSPADAESYPITDGTNATSYDSEFGYYTVKGSGNIFFRLGSPNDLSYSMSQPITLKWYDDSVLKTDTIYVSRGFDVDFYDKWSMYNVDKQYSFVKYPSQAGQLYQWDYNFGNNAMDPDPHNWSTAGVYDDSRTFKSSPCPPGYRMPKESAEEPEFSYLIVGHYSRPDKYNYDKWGYCADGYYDRRPYTGVGLVSAGTADVACPGMLYTMGYVQGSYVFLPAAGGRAATGAVNGKIGIEGDYYSQSKVDIPYGGYNTSIRMVKFSSPAYPQFPMVKGFTYVNSIGTGREAKSIRCIKE